MARKDKPYMPLYVQDFLTDEKLMECSASATGVYIRIMCIMHKSETYGTILLKQKDKQTDKQTENFAKKLARHLPYDMPTILGGIEELVAEGCLYIEGDLLVQKRMFEDGELSETRSESGSLGGISTQQKAKNFALANVQAKHEASPDIDNDNEIDNEIDNKVGIKKRESSSGVKKIGLAKKNLIDPFNGNLPKWQDWKDYKRKEHRFSFKSTDSENKALELLFNLSDGNIEMAEKIINESIGNGWKGLFQLKNNSNGAFTKKDISGGFKIEKEGNHFDKMK